MNETHPKKEKIPSPIPSLPCPAVCLAHMMQLEFQMLCMEFCSISGFQM